MSDDILKGNYKINKQIKEKKININEKEKVKKELKERALASLGGLWKNVAGRYEMNGKKVYAKQILKDPETYFTTEVMQALDEIAAQEFRYGS